MENLKETLFLESFKKLSFSNTGSSEPLYVNTLVVLLKLKLGIVVLSIFSLIIIKFFLSVLNFVYSEFQ